VTRDQQLLNGRYEMTGAVFELGGFLGTWRSSFVVALLTSLLGTTGESAQLLVDSPLATNTRLNRVQVPLWVSRTHLGIREAIARLLHELL
jgi:hypothetical protein